MKQVFITGASGFIGKHLCQRLLDDGVSVLAGVRTAEAAAKLPLGVNPWVTGNLESLGNWRTMLKNIDTVVHLAARAHILRETDFDPLASYRKVNVEGTRNLLDACHASSVRRLIYLSSIGTVGRGSNRPYRESDPCQPEDPYAQSKHEAEQLVLAANNNGGIETVILRPPLVYGPGVGANFLRIMNLARRGLPLPLGRVKSVRSMVFIDNLVDAILLSLSHPRASGEIFHVADQQPLTTAALVKKLAENFGKPISMWPIPIPLLQLAGKCMNKSADIDRLVRSLVVSTEKIEQTLDWVPLVTVEEGIQRTVEAYFAGNSYQTGKPSGSPVAA